MSRPVRRENSVTAVTPGSSRVPRLFCRLSMLLFSAIAFVGCTTSKLPDYAAPKVTFVSDMDMDMSDVIGYRQLTRDDFRGKEPPSNFDERMAAVTCVYTQPVVDREGIEIEPLASEDGEQVYKVTYNNLRYRALMNRSCSWWNNRMGDFDEDYVLEHEQIHFALFEAAAREWSREPPLQVRVKSQSRIAMKLDVKRQFEAQMRQRLDLLREENLRFDEDTSVGHNPARQKKWLQGVMTRLNKNADVAALETGGYCQIDAAARESINNARAAMIYAAERAAVGELLDEAESATRPPECDNVRAVILADKAYELARQSADSSCKADPAAQRAIARARDALRDDLDRMLRLIEQAENAARAPECDGVRARILADKALELATEQDPVGD